MMLSSGQPDQKSIKSKLVCIFLKLMNRPQIKFHAHAMCGS